MLILATACSVGPVAYHVAPHATSAGFSFKTELLSVMLVLLKVSTLTLATTVFYFLSSSRFTIACRSKLYSGSEQCGCPVDTSFLCVKAAELGDTINGTFYRISVVWGRYLQNSIGVVKQIDVDDKRHA
jgi:hypothetical protein